MNFILECIANIGFDAVKENIKKSVEERQVRKKLNAFLEKQNKLTFDCTKEEEIDFEKIAEYIRNDLIDDVKLRLFGDKEERRIARKSIIEKTVYYAQAKTRMSKERATKMVSTALEILRKYYEKKIDPDLLYVAARVEDNIIDEIDAKHTQTLEEIKASVKSFSNFSLEHSIKLAESGQIEEVGHNLSTMLKAVSTKHPLQPYYGYNINKTRDEMVSVPLSPEAITKYPPRFNINAETAYVGTKNISELQDYNITEYAYRHQLPITLEVVAAKKLLGDFEDPIQSEAKGMQGKKVVLKPLEFPKALPYSISMNDKIFFDYILMRTKEIAEDGTALLTNEEQENRPFDITFSINPSNRQIHFNIRPLAVSNAERLKYCRFIKETSIGGPIEIKSLSYNALLATGNIEPHLPEETLDLEIEFLQKIIEIERCFSIKLVIPKQITVENHQTIDHVYSIIHNGSFTGHWSDIKSVYTINKDFKKWICEAEDVPYILDYISNLKVELFGQEFSFPVKRKFEVVRFKELTRTKEKVNVLDVGDTITIHLVSDETDGNNTYVDTLAEEHETKNQLPM